MENYIVMIIGILYHLQQDISENHAYNRSAGKYTE